MNDFITHLSAHFKQLRASAITTDRVKEYVATRREEGAANGTINRELACLKRMFKLAIQSTPPKVARIPHIPMLEEHNARSGFFSHEEYLAVRGVLPDYAQIAVSIAYYTGLRIGEVLGLKWSQVDLEEGKLSLTPLQTKTETSRVVYLPPDLLRVLLEARRRHEASYPASPWVCQRYGKRLLEIKRCWKRACKRMGLEGRLVHDSRRTAVRNMTRAGIPEKVAMAISGHKTRSVFDRYNIVNETDLKVAATTLATYYGQEKVTLSVTLAELGRHRSGSLNPEPVETSAGFMEPAIRIERTTCGLRISDSPTSDNLTPQVTTNQDAPEMGADGGDLSCPGSSKVAEGARFENPTAPETIGSNLVSLFGSQSLTAESETVEPQGF